MMASLPWIKVDVNLPNHPKILRLEELLPGTDGLGLVVRVWTWAATYYPDGRIPNVARNALGVTARRDGALQALIDAGLIDLDGDFFVVHDWCDENSAHWRKAEQNRNRQKRFRDRNADRNAGGVTKALPDVEGDREGDQKLQKPLSADADASPTAPAAQAALPLLAAPEPPTPAARDLALEVFEHWRKVMGKNAATVFDAKRRKAVEARLREGRTAAELCKAIDGCKADPFSMGQNDRNTPFNDLALICRDASHVEKFIAFAESPPSRPVPSNPRPPPRARNLEERFAGMKDGQVFGDGKDDGKPSPQPGSNP